MELGTTVIPHFCVILTGQSISDIIFMTLCHFQDQKVNFKVKQGTSYNFLNPRRKPACISYRLTCTCLAEILKIFMLQKFNTFFVPLKTKTRSRAFSIAGPALWNALSVPIHNAQTILPSRKILKSHLFDLVFLPVLFGGPAPCWRNTRSFWGSVRLWAMFAEDLGHIEVLLIDWLDAL